MVSSQHISAQCFLMCWSSRILCGVDLRLCYDLLKQQRNCMTHTYASRCSPPKFHFEVRTSLLIFQREKICSMTSGATSLSMSFIDSVFIAQTLHWRYIRQSGTYLLAGKHLFRDT